MSYERGKAIEAVSRHAGDGWFMSITAVRPSTGKSLRVSPHVPDFMIFPERYITALCPSIGLLPTTVHVLVATLSTRVILSGPASNTRPSGSTNICG